MMADISHPSLIHICDFGVDESSGAYLIMEHIPGEALATILARVGKLQPSHAMELVAQAASALHAAHEHDLVHGDVRPGNMLIRTNGPLVLTSVGSARLVATAQSKSTVPVPVLPCYVSPEQAMGGEPTRLSDIYSLGVVAYQCLAGRRPFDGETGEAIEWCHIRQDAPALPRDIPSTVSSIVERCIAKHPDARWPTAAALATAAQRASGELAIPYEVFINYRRSDTAGSSRAIFQALKDTFGDSKVFFDTDSLDGGQDFVQATLGSVGLSRVVLAVIGPRWLQDRLHEADDLVRRELETALDAGKHVVPVLVEGATMPTREQLPWSITALADRNALPVRHDTFDGDLRRLIDTVRGAH
jgi:serine/threonine protein kinase